MPKLKVIIDADIDFKIEVEVEGFGLEASFKAHRKRKAIQGSMGLSEDLIDNDTDGDNSDQDSE